jgi:hypothetical protein
VDVVFLPGRFVGMTAYSLYHFSRNPHVVQVGCQTAAECMPTIPFHSLLLELGCNVVALQVVHPSAENRTFRGTTDALPVLIRYPLQIGDNCHSFLPRFRLAETGSSFNYFPLHVPLPVVTDFLVETLQFAHSKARETCSGNGRPCLEPIGHFDVGNGF